MKFDHVTFILGGARSGKSRKAEELIEAFSPPWFYLATAEAHDDEMRARIAEHQARRGDRWHSHDAPIKLPQAIAKIPAEAPLLVDCLTLWLTNLILGDHDVEVATGALLDVLTKRSGKTALVSNEVGLGIVPENALARHFRDAQGRLNQHLAAGAGSVIFMVAGYPMTVK